ncbi:Integrator complex subunit 1 [Homalodisca vitripennis]|nr:Integrator complex subunit 1 [Homalodisca vitripennis]
MLIVVAKEVFISDLHSAAGGGECPLTNPDLLLLYIEDSLGERLWVDQEYCKSFVDNILTAFSTKSAPAMEPEGRPELPEDPENITLMAGPASLLAKEYNEYIPVFNRFSTNQEAVEATVLEIVRENLNRRQAPDNITRNFLKLLASAAGLVEVRVLVSTRLEVWLQNPKLLRPAQELLMAVCVNCTGHTQKDVEVISALVKIRLKSKAVVNYYLACIRELITAHSDNLATVLKHTIYNELSQSRNPNNLAMLSVMFQYEPDAAATILADIFQELLLNRDDYLRPLRALLREIWRTLRSDLNLAAFSRSLMSQTEPLPRDCEFSQRAFSATADLITLCMFLATATFARPDKKDQLPTPEKMQLTVAGIQNDAVWWLQETAIRIYRPSATEFVHALHKVRRYAVSDV